MTRRITQSYFSETLKPYVYTFIMFLFLNSQPEISKPFIKKLHALLSKLNESSLLLVARVFDPSRQFIKPFLEKSDTFKRQRSVSIAKFIVDNCRIRG